MAGIGNHLRHAGYRCIHINQTGLMRHVGLHPARMQGDDMHARGGQIHRHGFGDDDQSGFGRPVGIGSATAVIGAGAHFGADIGNHPLRRSHAPPQKLHHAQRANAIDIEHLKHGIRRNIFQ